MDSTSKEVEAAKKNKRKVLELKNIVTEMNNETGRLTSDSEQLHGG